MSEYQKISHWIRNIETDLNQMRKKRAAQEVRIAKKIDVLVEEASRPDWYDMNEKRATYQRLNRLTKLVESSESTASTLEQVEKEVDKIYGDLSKNETYYFSRRSAANEELEKVEKEVDQAYGDQSKNETFYFEGDDPEDVVREAGWYEDVQKSVEDTYGDQSKNDTYYFNRTSGHKDIEAMKDLTHYDPEKHAPKIEHEWEELMADLDFDEVRNWMSDQDRQKGADWSDYAQLETEEAFEDDAEFIDDEDMIDL